MYHLVCRNVLPDYMPLEKLDDVTLGNIGSHHISYSVSWSDKYLKFLLCIFS